MFNYRGDSKTPPQPFQCFLADSYSPNLKNASSFSLSPRQHLWRNCRLGRFSGWGMMRRKGKRNTTRSGSTGSSSCKLNIAEMGWVTNVLELESLVKITRYTTRCIISLDTQKRSRNKSRLEFLYCRQVMLPNIDSELHKSNLIVCNLALMK